MLSKCVACDGKLKKIKKERDLRHCPTCNHYSFVEPIGTRKYDREYYEKYNRYEQTPLGQKINEIRWELVHRYLPKEGRVLDWGCGNGSFVRGKPNGYAVYGHDVNPFSPYKHASAWNEPWDAVTMFDVVEHLVHPEIIVRVMRPEYLFLVTPVIDWCGSVGELKRWKHFRPDEHQHYFSMKSLLTFLSRMRYDLKEFNYDEGRLRDPDHPEYLVSLVAKKRG